MTLLPQLASAGQFEDGVAAYKREYFSTALRLWLPIANQGIVEAQYNVALLYYGGGWGENKFKPNFEEALKWARLAVKQGYAPAYTTISNMYYSGNGVTQDRDKADTWLRLAAEKGDAYAQAMLGFRFRYGMGAPQDSVEAEKWYGLLGNKKVEMLWNCKDTNGRTTLTNQKADTEGKDCLIVIFQNIAEHLAKASAQQHSKAIERQSPPAAVRTMGTAFAIGKNVLLTNHHVIASCRRIRTEPHGAIAQVIASDKDVDLAVLRTNATFSDFARLSPATDVVLGQEIVIAGYPLPGLLAGGLNVTTGTVSSIAGLQNNKNTYQITAPIQPGNSGGPVFDRSGLVIGVVMGKLNELAVAQATGSLPQNVNFAVGMNAMRYFLSRTAAPTTEFSVQTKREISDIAASAQKFTVQLTCVR